MREMLNFVTPRRVSAFALAAALASPQPSEVLSSELKAETLRPFSRYVQATEARIEKQLADPHTFLYIDTLADAPRREAIETLRRGGVFMNRLTTLDTSGRRLEVPDGLVHHWIGDVFVPGASISQVLTLVEDYNHHQDIYKPEIVRSRLIGRAGNDFKIFYRLRKKKIITVTLDTEHNVHYQQLDASHWISRTYSTRIAEVEHADQPDEREKPIGHDSGFLWRMNSYWRFVERDGGVYIESESISLTRDIPLGLGWLVGPLVTSIPKQSLQMTLGTTRATLLERIAAARK